jgi:hypothetical protein
MTRRLPLRAIAHARAGDKGNRSNVAVFVYDPRHYGDQGPAHARAAQGRVP